MNIQHGHGPNDPSWGGYHSQDVLEQHLQRLCVRGNQIEDASAAELGSSRGGQVQHLVKDLVNQHGSQPKACAQDTGWRFG